MNVTGLHVYPVKSLGGQGVDEAVVERQGLSGDRRWCLVDAAGQVVTARQCRALLRLTAEAIDQHSIRLVDRADGASIVVPAPFRREVVPISLSGLPFATPADVEVQEWISERVNRLLRLVWQHDPASRTVSSTHGGQPGDVVSMADTGPVLLVSESSLAQLEEWMAQEGDRAVTTGATPKASSSSASAFSRPLDVLRFRPNVVVNGEDPFAEDAWGRVRIGSVAFRRTELCDRCVMTTIDPVTLAGGKEPLRSLARHRRWDGKTWFGIRMVPLTAGTLHVGDAVVPNC